MLFIVLLMSMAVKSMDIGKMTCEMQQNPEAITETSPRFGWQLTSDNRDDHQTAYQIEISQDKSANQLVWNSGIVTSSQSQWVKYAGSKLQEAQKYWWRVRVWDARQKASAWSNWNFFRLAPASASFNAQWIGAIRSDSARIPAGKRFFSREMGKPEYKAVWKNIDSLSRRSILLRKSFRVEKEITEAITYICGLGHYELTLNGKKVGESEFAPFWSDYDKTLYYNTYDVTSLLKKGENAVGVLLGNGFYNAQGGRYSKLKVSFGAPTLFFQTVIQYADQTSDVILSGPDWKFQWSPVTFNDIFGGEDYDARLEEKGWNLPGFNDLHWKPVVIQQAPKGQLTAQQGNPVKIMERLPYKSFKKLTTQECESASPGSKRKVDASAIVFDMAQNLSGFPEIKVSGKKGQKITLVAGESLTDEGAVSQRQTGRHHLYHYTLKGEGIEIWHPRFSYYGFRYIQVEGAALKSMKNPGDLAVLHDIQSCFVYNSSPQISDFESSNDIFNKAHVLIEKAVESNMQAVFTDCPHREKLGWLEQLHLNGPVLMYNYQLTTMIAKVMQDMADAQQPNGTIPTIAPMYNIFGDANGFDEFGDSPEWGSSFLILPKMYHQFYGDSSLIEKYYPAMRRYVDYLGTRANNNILSFGLGDWYDYGDFVAGYSKNTPVPFVATAYYFYDLKLMTEYAKMLGNQYDVKLFSSLAEKVRTSINTQFYNAQTGVYATGSQTAYSLALYLGIVSPENKQLVINNLIKDIQKHGNRLTTGDVGNRYLFQTLADNNLNELMYLMHNHEDAPGYGFQLKFGATTLTEQWDPRRGASWNHFMMGQIDEWFFASLAGIHFDEQHPGFQKIIIRPQPVGDLKYVRASTETIYGKVSVHWVKENNNFHLSVEIPVNCTAEVFIPGKVQPYQIKGGNYHFTESHTKVSIP